MIAQVVTDHGRLGDVEHAWRRLAESRGNAFITPEWFNAWARHYGATHSPLVGLVHDGSGALRGVLPLVVERGRRRAARFAGSSLGDHFHPAADRDDEVRVVRAIGELLRAAPRSWRALVLENVDSGAEWWQELSDASGSGATPLGAGRSVLPRLRLSGRSWDDVRAGLSRNLRSQLGRKRRALEREHDVTVRWTRDHDDIRGEMATLFRLHDLRWATQAGNSSLTSSRARAFHTDFAVSMRKRDWLRLAFLEVDSEPVAAWYGWFVGGRFAYYQAGFDPKWSDSSVGLLLFAETIRAALEEGAAEYDMLLGDEDFKLRFADSSRDVSTIMVAPRWRPSRLIAGGEVRARALGRRLPHTLRAPLKQVTKGVLDRLPLARRR